MMNWTFRGVLIPLMKISVRLGGESAWRILDALVTFSGSLVGRINRLRERAGVERLRGMAGIIDWADGLISVEGSWVEMDSTRAVKEITSCPYAEELSEIPEFCTRLGVSMGVAAFDTYAPDVSVNTVFPPRSRKETLFAGISLS